MKFGKNTKIKHKNICFNFCMAILGYFHCVTIWYHENQINDNLKQALSSNIFSKFSTVFSYFALKKFKNKLDPRKYNGAIFLGLNGPVVKSHGGTDALGFSYSLEVCYKIAKGNMMKKIKDNLSHIKKVRDEEK